MLIKNVIIDSFQEYSGEQSTVFFSKYCNFNCPWCYNHKEVTSVGNIGNFLDIYEDYINDMTTAIVFLGGEPSIYNELYYNIKSVKTTHPELKLKLFTNGSNIDNIMKCVPLLDSLSIDYKMFEYDKRVIGLSYENYLSDLNNLLSTLNTLVGNKSLESVEVRTTENEFVNMDDVDKIKKHINAKYQNVKFIHQKEKLK